MGTSSRSDPQYDSHGWKVQDERGYRIIEEPFGARRKLRVIHIGAGASGICFSKFARDRLENVEFQVYEKNDDIGGTWLENRYPGCACDIPSVCYQFTWDRNPEWSHYYSDSPEIWRYFKSVVERHDLMKHIKLRHKIIAAKWEEQEGLWHVRIRDEEQDREFTDTCNVLVNGGGILNNWKWPDIPGLHSFQGVLQHSAHYTEGLDLKGKRVAVIGTGSSGIQIVAKIAYEVDHLYTWVRSPTWITAGFAQKFASNGGGNFEYTPIQKQLFKENPKLYLKYSKMIESELNQRFKFILKNTPESKAAKEYATAEMKQKLANNPELMEKMIPTDFDVGCRRPTPGNGFLEALNRENVTVFTKLMTTVTPKGFIDHTGQEHEVDIIICATGFVTTWIPRFPVEANGTTLAKLWGDEAPSYLSVAPPSIPNYYMMGGPYGPLGHGSFLPILETLARYIIQIIDKMQTDRIKALTPRAEAIAQFKQHADLFLQRTAWVSGCSSWFKQGRVDGPLPMFPGSRLTYLNILEKPRFEHYQIEHCNELNMFEFLGDGFDVREFDGRDLSYYLGLIDGEDVQIDLEAELSTEMASLVPQASDTLKVDE
ncbi:hypothetical protein G647_03294 [Cladophialophora carrionii CBS 160.54]|uniref:FAD/NAD(P)-binding domain-containing protein n=1 Tax=Cladophialophora carrionii CBS 160.54 TaxID=1279043 RepID=V9DKP3_9EURO|nr:uncharacterized protein G647_03294 [Cladophialophora carrionii CBS 160.54]ETI26517.1 hypothetical protein G647_03294 [Cladophialophora carrionii CBS 160.54]